MNVIQNLWPSISLIGTLTVYLLFRSSVRKRRDEWNWRILVSFLLLTFAWIEWMGRLHLSPSLQVLVWLFAVVMATIALTDATEQLIPNRIVLPAIVGLGALECILLPWGIARPHLLGALYVGVPFAIITVVWPKGLGGGDWKLAMVVGLFGGWQFAVMVMLLAHVFGLAQYSVRALRKKGKKVSPYIPLAPSVWLAFMILAGFGQQILVAILNVNSNLH